MEYRLSGLAEQDLLETWLYVAADVNGETANRVVDAIVQRFDLLTEQPRMGRLRPSRESFMDGEIRSLPGTREWRSRGGLGRRLAAGATGPRGSTRSSRCARTIERPRRLTPIPPDATAVLVEATAGSFDSSFTRVEATARMVEPCVDTLEVAAVWDDVPANVLDAAVGACDDTAAGVEETSPSNRRRSASRRKCRQVND